jgi:hypothetical protein
MYLYLLRLMLAVIVESGVSVREGVVTLVMVGMLKD